MVADQSLIFVYGTLKRGFPNHQYLEKAQFLADAVSEPLYFMVNCGHYPGLRYVAGSQLGVGVQGEVFCVDAEILAVLDEVEGVSQSLYCRERIRLKGAMGARHVWAWFYLSDRFDQQVVGDCWV